tara:strand:- start:1231 stop:1566 length:336 start_codon:yes stop_codon:yes gene_type:complete
MDINQILDAYGTIGTTGVLSLFFGFLITNLVKSQNSQSESLDKMMVDIARSETKQNNIESILLKLLDRIQREGEQQNDERSRRHEQLLEEQGEISKELARLSGSVSRLNGK